MSYSIEEITLSLLDVVYFHPSDREDAQSTYMDMLARGFRAALEGQMV